MERRIVDKLINDSPSLDAGGDIPAQDIVNKLFEHTGLVGYKLLSIMLEEENIKELEQMVASDIEAGLIQSEKAEEISL